MSVVIATLDLVAGMYSNAFYFSSRYASIMSFLKLDSAKLDNATQM